MIESFKNKKVHLHRHNKLFDGIKKLMCINENHKQLISV